MNIFFLHIDPKTCAQMHCDKHVIKMILETCQLLCSAWHMTDPCHILYTPPYKLCHKNHPCSIWTRENTSNYKYLCELGLELAKEYTYRYGKIHKSEKYIKELQNNIPPLPITNDVTHFTQAMPNMFKSDDNKPDKVIEAYRTFYFFEKSHILSWKGKIAGRDKPHWIVDFENMFN